MLGMNDVTKLNTWGNHSIIKQTRTQKASHLTEVITVSSSWHFVSIYPLHHLRAQLHNISQQPQHFESMLLNISFMLKPKPTDSAPHLPGKLLCSSVCENHLSTRRESPVSVSRSQHTPTATPEHRLVYSPQILRQGRCNPLQPRALYPLLKNGVVTEHKGGMDRIIQKEVSWKFPTNGL